MSDRAPRQACELTADGFQPRSLVEILSFLRDLDPDQAKVRSQDIDFTYSAMFDTPWSDPETEALRKEFLKKVGPESGRYLCRYELHHHTLDRFADGFTDDDLESLLGRLTMAIIMVLHHADLAPDDFSLELTITEEGELCGRLLRDATGVAAKLRNTRH